MAAKIRSARPHAKVELVGETDAPGTFDVVIDSQRVWSKHETGEFPEEDAIVAQVPDAPAS